MRLLYNASHCGNRTGIQESRYEIAVFVKGIFFYLKEKHLTHVYIKQTDSGVNKLGSTFDLAKGCDALKGISSIDLIQDTRHLCKRLRTDFSWGRQVKTNANAKYGGRFVYFGNITYGWELSLSAFWM